MGNIAKASALSVAVAMACSGCALFNPYVSPKDADNNRVLPPIGADEFAGRVAPAIKYADQWRVTYIEAASTHSTARNVTAAILLPLTAVSLFYGITDHGSTDRITRMALGGAMIYTGTEFLTSKPRQLVYLAGAQALTCAIVATRPYIVTNSWFDNFESRRKTLEAHAADLAHANAELASAIEVADSSVTQAQLDTARRVYASADRALKAADAQREQAGAIVNTIGTVGLALEGAVRSINDAVDLQVTKTEPDLESLRNLSTGMEGLAQSLVGSAWPPQPSEESSAEQKGDGATDGGARSLGRLPPSTGAPARRGSAADLRDKQAEVIKHQALLAQAGETLKTDLQTIASIAKNTTALGDCKPKDVLIAFTITPDVRSLTIEKDKIAVVSADGGVGVPGWELTGTNTNAFDVSATTQKMGQLTLMITAKADIAAGAGPTLTLRDGNRTLRFDVKLEVAKPSARR